VGERTRGFGRLPGLLARCRGRSLGNGRGRVRDSRAGLARCLGAAVSDAIAAGRAPPGLGWRARDVESGTRLARTAWLGAVGSWRRPSREREREQRREEREQGREKG
jgi:hypothetical protein